MQPGSWLALALLTVLAACGGGGGDAPPLSAPSLRDPAVPIRSLAGIDLRDLQGVWHEVAHLAPAPGCRGQGITLSPGMQGEFDVQGRICTTAGPLDVAAPARPAGPGRLALRGQPEAWWVIWADHAHRTLVLATPGGDMAVVLDRGQIGQDRLRAAREILDFNGFDVRLLQPG